MAIKHILGLGLILIPLVLIVLLIGFVTNILINHDTFGKRKDSKKNNCVII